ncbi:hypothetical protein [Nonomuraea salmonea]|uniref:hypothetical protein n=1 Tax=Nonomuraea salmonea TaxID=46181 RepID=UPI002FE7ED74
MSVTIATLDSAAPTARPTLRTEWISAIVCVRLCPSKNTADKGLVDREGDPVAHRDGYHGENELPEIRDECQQREEKAPASHGDRP